MSSGRRAYDLLRGYVNQEWERIQGVDRKSALGELDSPADYAAVKVERTVTIEQEIVSSDPQDWARRILGVGPTADFSEIRKSFERLNTRSDPSKFPVDSPESRQASDIQRRVQRAYSILTDGIDSTEKRFKSLEID